MTESDTPETTPADETKPVAETVTEQVVEAPPTSEPAETAETAATDEAAAPAGDPSVVGEPEQPAAEAVVAAPRRDVDARNPVWAVGRRKSSTARIRMFPGGGNFVINGKPLDEYFRLVKDQHDATKPLHVADVRKKYDVWVNADGGGMTGQSGAVALGVARALVILEPATEQVLRDAGLMSRDARVKERKKYGRRGARRGFQFSKR